MTDDLNTRDSQSGGDTDATHGNSGAKTEEVIDWKAKADGYNGEAIKQRNRATVLTEKVTTLTGRVAELEVERDAQTQALTGKLTAAEQQANQHKADADRLRREKEVGKKVRKDFSNLTDLFDEGLLNLNHPDDAALEDYLTKMSASIGGLADARIKDKTAGSTPPPPSKDKGSAAGDTIEDINAGMQNALKTKGFNSPEYQGWYQKYLAHVKNRGAK